MTNAAQRRTFATRDEQQALVEPLRAARARFNAAMDEHAAGFALPLEIGIDASNSAFVDTEAYRRARAAQEEIATLEEEYFRRLPRPALSRCPICDAALHRVFDPFGIDGPWWRSDTLPDEPQPCPHFCVLLGAVDLAACRSKPDFDAHVGPGAPFVVPRLLEHAGMVAVLSSVALADGGQAYAVAYFAPRRPPVQELTAPWARTNFVYTTQLGVHAWRAADVPPRETWDFALEPWLSQQKLRWCQPGAAATLAPSLAPCPFVGQGGVRQAQTVFASVVP